MKKSGYNFFSGIRSTWRLLKRLTGKKANVVLLQTAIFTFLICYQTLFQPYILTEIYAALGTGEPRALFTVCAIGGSIVSLFFSLSYLNNVYLDLYSFRIKLLGVQNACRELFKLPYDKINDQFNENELINRIDAATLNFITVIISLGLIISNTINIVVLLSMFSSYSYILIIIVILLAIWGGVSSRIEIKLRKKYEIEYQRLEDGAGGILYNSIHEIAFTSMFGCTERLYNRYGKMRSDIWNTKWKQEKTALFVSLCTSMFSSMLRGFLSGALYSLHKTGLFPAYKVTSSFSIYDQLSAVVSKYASPFVEINTQLVNIKRLNEVIEFQYSEPSKWEPLENNCLIKGENLYYGIDEKVILNNISLNIKRGEKIALIGRSGCGKSTLLRVLAGLYHVNRGDLTFNSKFLNTCRDISYIPASAMLYDDTVDSNILMNGDGSVENALNLAEFDMAEQTCGLPATNLSGGQAQRVNIARGLINEAPLLLADEPVSSLSMAQGDIVIKNIVNESETAIVVTHHPTHLRFFSHIILMEDGEIVASGTLDKVSAHPAYKRWSGRETDKNASEGA